MKSFKIKICTLIFFTIFSLMPSGVTATELDRPGRGNLSGGNTTISDVVIIMKHILELTELSSEQLLVADVTRDGKVDIIDVSILSKYILGHAKTLPIEKEYIISSKDIRIGQRVDTLDPPNRIDLSIDGYDWYIYNDDYSKYLQIAVHNGIVIGFHSNANLWLLADEIRIGDNKTLVDSIYSNRSQTNDHYHTYFADDFTITTYFDSTNDSLTAVTIFDSSLKENIQNSTMVNYDLLCSGMERQVFDLANTVRARNGLIPYKWCDNAAAVARKHCQDMNDRDFFNHINPDGEGPSNRMNNNNQFVYYVGENIAMGQRDAIDVHERWMNSNGHRRNILGDYTYLGVGITSNQRLHFTQLFHSTQNVPTCPYQ